MARTILGLAFATSLFAADPALLSLTYSGDQAALESLDARIKAAGTEAQKLAPIEADLLQVLRNVTATFTAKQAAAQRLALVLAHGPAKRTAADFRPLPAMLLDERDSDLARLALEPVPGAVVDEILVKALDKATGRMRLGLIDSLGRRRTEGAVATLAKLLKDTDVATAAAAAQALGEIASPTAAAALHATPEPTPPAIAMAKLAAATRMPAGAAQLMLAEMERSAREPAHRAAALRIALEADPNGAAARIAEVLGGNDWTRKQVALESLASSRARDLVSTLTGKLATWDAPTQSAVIAALGRRREAAALEAIKKATSHESAEVRAAAIEALGSLPGNRDTAILLAQIAAGEKSGDAKLAKQSLARLDGPDVDAAVVGGAERGESKLRVVYLEQLALRNQTDALPLLVKARSDTDATVRAAAVGALGDIAPVSEQKTVLDWAMAAKDETEQTRALRALVNVTLRNPSPAKRGQLVYDAIEKAPPEQALRLLPALARIGGEASAESAARIALGQDEKLAKAAVDALSRWTDRTALAALATVAEKSAAHRQAAVDSVLRSFERAREPWAAGHSEVLARVLGATNDADARKRLLALLGRANDQRALTVATSLQDDPALGAEARVLREIIGANLAGKPRLRGSGAETQLNNVIDGRTNTRWSVPADGDEWIEIEFRRERPMRRITLDQTGRDAEFPEHFEVLVMDDRAMPGSVLASGKGKSGKTVIELPANTRGRILRIKNTSARAETPWAICELIVE